MADDWDEEDDGLVHFDPYDVALRPPAPPIPHAPAPVLTPTLRLTFHHTTQHLDVPPGGELRLGRDSAWAPEAAPLLADRTGVSAKHATVTYAEDGTASVTEVPQGATNGVKVNDHVLDPGRTEQLAPGDTVWLGPFVSFTVCTV